jgi:Pilus biogenesis CpaD protein (pilus_cpaD)
MRLSFMTLALGLVVLTGCEAPYSPTPKPDYTIRVLPSPNGTVAAVPPTCPSWTTATTDPYDNKPLPQLGCATARNLAMMVDQPEDLVHGRTLGPASGVTAVGSVLRYNNDQTRGLIWTGTDPNQLGTTTASTAASAITGELKPPGAGGSSSSSSSSASGP